jgi:hypothetical protein
MPPYRTWPTLLVTVSLAAACTADPVPAANTPTTTPPDRTQAQTTMPSGDTVLVQGADAASLAMATSRALFGRAPAVVLVEPDDEAALTRATSTAVDLGMPLLLTPNPADEVATASAALRAEVDRLDPTTLVAVGDGAAGWTRTGGVASSPATRSTVTLAAGAADNAVLPAVRRGAPLDQLLVLAVNNAANAAASAIAKAAGARILTLNGPDPRAEDAAIKALAAAPPKHVLALGAEFGPADRLRRRIDAAATGVQLPGGGQVVFPGRRMVALYGHPGNTQLGSLGEQSLDATVARARKVASSYASLFGEPVVPAFEIIATVASNGPGPDGDYSSESSVESLRPWVEAAKAAGIYVVLDLQPGRTDFLTQAQRYAELLAQPHVGLALDPEWRLKPEQVHLAQIGSVTADEINRTGAWLAGFTREHKLPQKVLMLHQFTTGMISNRSTLVTDYDELRVVIHADGFGSAGAKFNTWKNLHQGEPANVFWGWKNFYDEDKPTFSPPETVAVSPSPVFVSYQ